ncbi:hypothetical protein Rwratislav_36099 [Rhodococcus wratislaviensis IFP 2016]|nr:hypothetical protein Rwratislav_36099 [Rhodococcus wratislaviensis IFP 2016]
MSTGGVCLQKPCLDHPCAGRRDVAEAREGAAFAQLAAVAQERQYASVVRRVLCAEGDPADEAVEHPTGAPIDILVTDNGGADVDGEGSGVLANRDTRPETRRPVDQRDPVPAQESTVGAGRGPAAG